MALRRYFGKISFLNINQLVGNNGELVIDETTDKVYIMDGVTPGGHEIANVSANLNLEFTNVSPAIDSAYTLGTNSYRWNNLYVNDSNFYGNIAINTWINPNNTNNNWGNLKINANKIYGNLIYAQTDITTDGSLSANIISANGFIEINTSNFSGYTFSNLGSGTTGLIHANVGNVSTIYLSSNGNSSFTSYANGYNTVGGYTQFFSNVYVTGNNVTIPTETTIGLLPSFTPSNAKLTHVDSVNSFSQVLLQNKSNGANASGDLVVTADNGSDSTYYIDLGINSSTFSGGGGLDAANDGYLLVEGGKLVVATLTANKDIVFAIGGDSASNEVGRFKSGNGLVVNGNVTTNGNIIPYGNSVYSLGSATNQWKSLYVSNNTIYIGGTAIQVANGSLLVGGNSVSSGSTYSNSNVAAYLPTDSTITALYSNAATQASNLGAIVGGTVTHANLITTGGLYWANGVSALTSASTYGNTQVSAYYVANTVATSNVQILKSGNIRLPTGATINESSGNGYLTLNPNTSADALAGVVIGGSGYLLSPNGTRNAVLNYNAVNGQMGIYVVNVYGNQQNAIVNGGSNNYGNIGSISTFFGNAFVSNIYSPNYLYPNGTSILSGVSGNYGNTQVAAYLQTATAVTANLGNVITNNGVYYANGVSILSGISGNYGNTQVGAYLPTYNGNIGNLATGNLIPTANTTYYLGNSTLYWANAYANNFNALTQIATPKIQFTVGGSQILEDNSLDLAIVGPYQVSIKGNGTQQYTFGYDGSFAGPGGYIAWANGAIGGNVIATGVYWSNGVAFSSGSSTYGNTQVGYYLNSNLISSTISLTGNVIANAHYGNSFLYSNGVSILTGISGTYGNTQVGYYLNSNLISSTISITGNVIANAHYGNSYLYSNGVSILTGISGSATPSGGNTMIQFANSGSFGGSTYLQYNYISGNLVSNSTTTSTSTTTGAIVVGGGVGIGGALTVGGNISAGNVNVTANVNAANINVTGNLTYGNISTTGNVTAGWLITTGTGGNITGANYVIASNFTATGTANVGNVITTSGVYWANGVAYSSGGGSYSNTDVAGYLIGNITIGNLVSNGGGQIRGYHTGAIGANIANTGAFTTISASSNISAFASLNVVSNVGAGNFVANTAMYSAAYNYANGAAYAGTYSNSNVASYLPTYTGNVGAGNLIGTSSNVTITAGANVWTFDNTGNLTLPNLGNVYVLGANTNGNININTIGSGVVNINGNITANSFSGTNAVISGNLYSPSQTGKSAAIVAQNTSVTMDNIKVQWLNNGSGNANQLQFGSLSGTPSILYTYVYQSGLGGGSTGGSSSTSLSTTYANIGNPSGTAGDFYLVTATVGTNAYRVSAITGSGYSNNLISIERLI